MIIHKPNWLIFLLFYPILTQAEVVLDGTLGPGISLEGPEFNITADLGQQYGGNLFHSFQVFNLTQKETATFSGPNSVENIISRITGGEMSFIDGKLQSEIINANLYLLNPDGIIFGPNATLDIQGALHISTATQLHLGNSGTFDTRHPERSFLVSAPPSAFGFLDPEPATIEIRESQLVNGQTLSILGGNINIDGGQISADRVNIAAISRANELISTATALELESNAELGNIVLKNNARIEPGSGDIYIRAGQFFMDNSNLVAEKIAIDVNELHLNAADIDSSAGVAGNADHAGNIHLKVQNLNLFNSRISTTGGDITIEASQHIKLIGLDDFPSAIQVNEGRLFIRAGFAHHQC